MENPAISVIIPMYNAEKFIAACLQSLLDQTFQNFEIIVVDDCSTDSSVAIVESYAEKFNGRLTLSGTKKNSEGGGYVPRNIGLGLSHGEYICFADADDFIVKTALEILYTAAKSYNSDVVYISTFYALDETNNFSQIADSGLTRAIKDGISEKPAVTQDAKENLYKLLFGGEFRNPWTKFVRRDFLASNRITFPKIISGGDFIWTIQVYCHAERLLRLPIPLYFYRSYSAESITRKKRSSPEQVAHWISAFVLWLRALKDLAKDTEILNENPAYCWQAALAHFMYCLNCCEAARNQLDITDVYEALSSEFPNDLVIPFLFSVIDEQQKILLSQSKGI